MHKIRELNTWEICGSVYKLLGARQRQCWYSDDSPPSNHIDLDLDLPVHVDLDQIYFYWLDPKQSSTDYEMEHERLRAFFISPDTLSKEKSSNMTTSYFVEYLPWWHDCDIIITACLVNGWMMLFDLKKMT